MTKAVRGDLLKFAHDLIENSRGPGPCILWPYSTSGQGYPVMSVKGKQWLVTRYIMSAIDGPDRSGMQVAHQPLVCHTPMCVRPAHLRWATPSENQRDRLIDGTHWRVLTALDAKAIREIYASGGITQNALAIRYGVKQSHICGVISGHHYKEKELS